MISEYPISFCIIILCALCLLFSLLMIIGHFLPIKKKGKGVVAAKNMHITETNDRMIFKYDLKVNDKLKYEFLICVDDDYLVINVSKETYEKYNIEDEIDINYDVHFLSKGIDEIRISDIS